MALSRAGPSDGHLGLATQDFLLEMLAEAFTQPVESKGVDAGIAEGQRPGEDGSHQMESGRIYGSVVGERTVQVEDVVG